MPRRMAELVLLGGFLILAVLLYRSTAGYPPSVQGSTAMYVRFLGVALALLCGLEIVFALRKRERREPREGESDKMAVAARPLRFWGLFVLLLAYSALLSTLGFYLASALFLPLAMLLLGQRKPVTILLTTGGVLLFVYLVFVRLLEVSLPAMNIG